MEGIKIKKAKNISQQDVSSITEDTRENLSDSVENYSKIPSDIKDKWYKYIIHNATEGFFITDMNTRILDVNDAFCNMSGYSRKELLNMGLYDLDVKYLNSPNGKQEMIAVFKNLIGFETKPNEFSMVQHRRKDGRIIDISVSLKYMNVMGGVFFHFNRDVTMQKQLYQQLKESEDMYRTLVELGDRVGEAVVMLQDTEKVEALQTFVSDEWCRITGYDREELLKKSFFDILHPKYLKNSIERHRKKMGGSVIPHYFEMYIINKSGVEVPIELTSGYTNYHGSSAIVAYIKDITERKMIEKELEQYNINLEQLVKKRTAELENMNRSLIYFNNNRTKFIQSVVHELKTPITPIQAASEILVAELPKGPLRELAVQINQGAKNLDRRVDELRDIAKSERGILQVELKLIDTNRVIREAVKYMAIEANKKNVALSLEMPQKLPKIKGDRDRIHQVILNLLSNSIKYTHAGGKINVAATTGENEIIVAVQDSGCGLTKTQMEHLFDMTPKPHNKADGLGLGLIISKNIIERHGGSIFVQSKRNRGSTFTFTIPIPQKEG
ncbi:MAG: PAS domain-containing sensor histidine kinase [Dehalococcoidales bacterium]|nr:PAS domain-containing sensor histidine kinase [Dehalococcoidales bacterium]